MSRIAFVLALLLGIISPALAAQHVTAKRMATGRVTIDQLEQLLATDHGQSDGNVARQLRGLELTERASSVRLARWEAEFPGRHCREVLTVLADTSAFLNLPASDMPATPPPDFKTQAEIVSKAIDYAARISTRLPNFYAARKTERFEDTPPEQTIEHLNMSSGGRGSRTANMPAVTSSESEYKPLHFAGRSSIIVSYRDGYEVQGSRRIDFSKPLDLPSVLTTSGEFGPIIFIVLVDSAHGSVTWGHWEQGPAGPEAVFRYSVPQEYSRYVVALPHGIKAEEIFPAYHGTIAVDPATGSILRISIVADLASPNQNVSSSLLVEYGEVPLGGTSYICPVKSVALLRMPFGARNGDSQDTSLPIQTQLNDVVFTDYHLFRAEARVLIGDSASSQETPTGASAPESGPGK